MASPPDQIPFEAPCSATNSREAGETWTRSWAVTDSTYLTPEARARREIDKQLEACGWVVQNMKDLNLYAAPGVAVREFPMTGGNEADYLLFIDGLDHPTAGFQLLVDLPSGAGL